MSGHIFSPNILLIDMDLCLDAVKQSEQIFVFGVGLKNVHNRRHRLEFIWIIIGLYVIDTKLLMESPISTPLGL